MIVGHCCHFVPWLWLSVDYVEISIVELLWCQLASPFNGSIQCYGLDWDLLKSWHDFLSNIFAGWRILRIIFLTFVAFWSYMNRAGVAWLFYITFSGVSECRDFIMIFSVFPRSYRDFADFLPWFSYSPNYDCQTGQLKWACMCICANSLLFVLFLFIILKYLYFFGLVFILCGESCWFLLLLCGIFLKSLHILCACITMNWVLPLLIH